MNNDIFDKLNGILENVKLDDVTSEQSGSIKTLADGYYLCEVKSATLTESKSSGNPMASFRLQVVEDGKDVIFEDDEIKYINLEKSKGQYIFKHFVLKDETSIKRFVSDMLKFEDEKGESYLPKEAFLNGELIDEALASLEGMRIYCHLATTENKNGENSTWTNFVSWNRAKDLDLPL